MTRNGSSASSTGLATSTAGVLCYLGWWVTGAIFWVLERDDRDVRLHAAQSVIAFGSMTVFVGMLAAAGLLALSFAPAVVFSSLLLLGGVSTAAAFILWVAALW